MKKQIRRLSPHQNGKVAGIISVAMYLPMYLITIVPFFLFSSGAGRMGNPVNLFPFSTTFFLFMPILYFILTYLFVACACWLYNIFFQFIGGFEFEFDLDDEDDQDEDFDQDEEQI